MKNAEIIIDGEKYSCQIGDEVVDALKNGTKRTGYERNNKGLAYWFCDNMQDLSVESFPEADDNTDDRLYNSGNYYNSEELARNIVRADRLMQSLRQWQALNDEPVGWDNRGLAKWYIYYDYTYKTVYMDFNFGCRAFGEIYFTSSKKAMDAIEAFKDELTWYFTEYMQRLDEKNMKSDNK